MWIRIFALHEKDDSQVRNISLLSWGCYEVSTKRMSLIRAAMDRVRSGFISLFGSPKNEPYIVKYTFYLPVLYQLYGRNRCFELAGRVWQYKSQKYVATDNLYKQETPGSSLKTKEGVVRSDSHSSIRNLCFVNSSTLRVIFKDPLTGHRNTFCGGGGGTKSINLGWYEPYTNFSFWNCILSNIACCHAVILVSKLQKRWFSRFTTGILVTSCWHAC